MNTYLFSDSHFNHENIATYCKRPANFTEIIIQRWNEIVKPEDLVIHLGDVMIGKKAEWIIPSLTGRKVLIRGNHDREKGSQWWMEHGFDFCCEAMVYRRCWLTHEPYRGETLPYGCEVNIHGHLHNFMETSNHAKEFQAKPWHRLFACEYTDYRPIEFNKFLFHPEKFRADIERQMRGLK